MAWPGPGSARAPWPATSRRAWPPPWKRWVVVGRDPPPTDRGRGGSGRHPAQRGGSPSGSSGVHGRGEGERVRPRLRGGGQGGPPGRGQVARGGPGGGGRPAARRRDRRPHPDPDGVPTRIREGSRGLGPDSHAVHQPRRGPPGGRGGGGGGDGRSTRQGGHRDAPGRAATRRRRLFGPNGGRGRPGGGRVVDPLRPVRGPGRSLHRRPASPVRGGGRE